ncbi:MULTISPECIES: DNA cytosine methyltransferase [Bacillus cereus group]|uniref:DNA cytosine methyltransferase n=1 Tax=Bacillus cereus group TaxID=86661 RepID=UPI001BABA09B|nr:DNA (cytosine-5-)-methyltransferase [Bacillus cereus]
MKRKYKVLDLFSGAGGMSEGFLQAGFHIPCAVDYSKEAAETYKNRHKQLGLDVNFYTGDIRDLSQNKKRLKEFLDGHLIDVIVGGPPCQGFSLSGKRLADDIRNTLFLEYLKIVELVGPKYFVIENVEGLLSYKFEKIKGIDGQIYEDVYPQEVIKSEAFKLGYLVEWKILNAKDFGVPQNRTRVIFLGHKIRRYRGGSYRSLVTSPNFPREQNNIVTVEDAISDLNFIKNGEVKTKYNNKFGNKSEYQKMLREGLTPGINGKPIKVDNLYNHQTSKHNEKTIQRFKLLRSGESISDLLQRLPHELRAEYFTKKFRCIKLSKFDISPTVLTLPDDIIHYDLVNPRILTVRELARLQSFDDSFEFKGKRTTGGDRRKFETPQYTQVGNAVPPLLARHIAEEIINALNDTKKVEKGEIYG